jgi:ArsR family transcriptional regulator, arsenate/arsenite/antimonite-responsive transcriptional repressor
MQYAVREVEVGPISRMFKALGDETRMRIVALLSHGELCVCHLEEALALTQSNCSRQLSVLRGAGLVASRREGTWVYYRLAKQTDPDCERQLRGLVRSFADHDQLRKDAARLVRTRNPDNCR